MLEKDNNTTMMIWISYDLGIDGDYEGLYEWLDLHEAKECGDNLAVLSFTYKKDITEDLIKDLKKKVKFREKDRIYLIYRKDDKEIGKFLFGRRRFSPWKGHAKLMKGEVDAF